MVKVVVVMATTIDNFLEIIDLMEHRHHHLHLLLCSQVGEEIYLDLMFLIIMLHLKHMKRRIIIINKHHIHNNNKILANIIFQKMEDGKLENGIVLIKKIFDLQFLSKLLLMIIFKLNSVILKIIRQEMLSKDWENMVKML